MLGVLMNLYDRLEISEFEDVLYAMYKLELQAKVEILTQILRLLEVAKMRKLTIGQVEEKVRELALHYEELLQILIENEDTFKLKVEGVEKIRLVGKISI